MNSTAQYRRAKLQGFFEKQMKIHSLHLGKSFLNKKKSGLIEND